MKRNPFTDALLTIAILMMIFGVIGYFAGAGQPDAMKLAIQSFCVAVVNGGAVALLVWLLSAAIDWRSRFPESKPPSS